MKTAIIGGGVGGIITALYLSQEGHDVTIFEKKKKLGGRLAFVGHEGYKIDEGPTIVLLPEMIFQILDEVGIPRDELEMVRCDPLYKIAYPNGFEFYKWSDVEKQLTEISEHFPGEEGNFQKYLADMEERFHQGKQAFLDRPFINKRDFWTFNNMSILWKLKAYQSVRKQAKSYFNHPKLQDAFSFQTLYVGGAPFQSPALYSLIPFSEHYHGVWYVKGGYASIVSLLEKKLKENGVEIFTDHHVESLNIDNENCRSISVNGECLPFDWVVMNGDFPMMEQLLPSRKKKQSYTSSSSCLLIYLGLDRIYEKNTVHQYFMTDNFEEHMNDVFNLKRLPEKPSIYTFHPSIIDSTLAPEGKGVLYILVPVPTNEDIDWNNIEDYIEKVISEVEDRGFEGLRESIVWKKVRTPKDALIDGLYQGGSFGIAPTLKQSGVFRPQVKIAPYENVFAVGASVHPGGGIPIVMQGAKLLAEHLLHEELVRSS